MPLVTFRYLSSYSLCSTESTDILQPLTFKTLWSGTCFVYRHYMSVDLKLVMEKPVQLPLPFPSPPFPTIPFSSLSNCLCLITWNQLLGPDFTKRAQSTFSASDLITSAHLDWQTAVLPERRRFSGRCCLLQQPQHPQPFTCSSVYAGQRLRLVFLNPMLRFQPRPLTNIWPIMSATAPDNNVRSDFNRIPITILMLFLARLFSRLLFQ